MKNESLLAMRARWCQLMCCFGTGKVLHVQIIPLLLTWCSTYPGIQVLTTPCMLFPVSLSAAASATELFFTACFFEMSEELT